MSPSSLFTTRSTKSRVKPDKVGKHAVKTKYASSAPAVEWQPDVLRKTSPILKKRRTVKPEKWQIAPAGNRSFLYVTTKRTIDILGAATLLILLSPLLLTVLAILFVTTKGHPIYSHERLGLLGRPFRLYKFRTMVMDAEKLQALVKNQHTGPIFKNNADPRVTRLGKLLRRTSIDELPQLFNILLGKMTLVGPRPPLEKEVAEYEPWQRKRLSVKPGLTCLWQVSGRSEIGFHRWMLMDLWYVRHQSLLTDLGLLLRTPWAVLNRNGAY
jgi:lipopolysaccharide/colanic/teichoic acid biosynthesis glycosyltransferase